MKAFFKLIRWKNLLIIALTMIAMRELIIVPVFAHYDVEVSFSIWGFCSMVLSTILIAAGGYVINDYYDMRIDRINKSEKMIIGTSISRRKTIFLHLWLNIYGVLFGILASIAAHRFWYIFIFIGTVILLWLYSVKFKKNVFWGNLLIALLTAITPLLVGITEYFAVEDSINSWNLNQIRAVKMAMQVIIFFSVFAFLFTLIREIIKDCEDLIGDKANNINTIPIAIGLTKTNFIIFGLSIISMVFIAFVWYAYLGKTGIFGNNLLPPLYLLVFVMLPTLFVAVRSLFGTAKIKYTRLSKFVKLIMLFGLVFTFIFSYIIYNNGII